MDDPPSEGSTTMQVTPVTFDRTINLPFLVTVVAAIAAGSAWTSSINNRMTAVETSTQGLPEMRERLARMDERGEASRSTLQRVERILDDMGQ